MPGEFPHPLNAVKAESAIIFRILDIERLTHQISSRGAERMLSMRQLCVRNAPRITSQPHCALCAAQYVTHLMKICAMRHATSRSRFMSETLMACGARQYNAQPSILFDAKFSWRDAVTRQTIAIARRTLPAQHARPQRFSYLGGTPVEMQAASRRAV